MERVGAKGGEDVAEATLMAALHRSLREVFTAQGIALQAIAQGKRLSLLI